MHTNTIVLLRNREELKKKKKKKKNEAGSASVRQTMKTTEVIQNE